MIQKIYRCPACGFEECYPKDSKVWCGCREKNKMQMFELNPELQKIMKEEMKLNLKHQKW